MNDAIKNVQTFLAVHEKEYISQFIARLPTSSTTEVSLDPEDLREVLRLAKVGEAGEVVGTDTTFIFRTPIASTKEELQLIDVLSQMVSQMDPRYRGRVMNYIWSKYGTPSP